MSKPTGEVLEKWFKSSRDANKEWREEAREMYDLRSGHQWSKSELKEKRRLPIVMNRIGPFVDAVLGHFIENQNVVRYLPVGLDDNNYAEMMSETARWCDAKCDAKDEGVDMYDDLLVCGMGWSDTRMDYKVDPEGRLNTQERIDPFEMDWDTGANKRNLSDASYVIHTRKYKKGPAEERWPQLKKMTVKWATDDPEEPDVEPHDATNNWKYENDQSGRYYPKVQMYLISRCQYFLDEPIYRYADPEVKEVINVPAERFEERKKQFDELGIKYIKATERKYYQAFFIGDEILEEDLAPSQEGFTLKAVCGKRDRNKRMWYGVIRAMKDPQKFSNKFFSDMIHIFATNRKGGAFIEVDALADAKKAEEDWSKPDALIKLNRGGLNKIKEREAAVIPQGLDRLFSYAVDAVPNVTGLSEEFRGMADRDQPTSLEVERKKATIAVLAVLHEAYNRYQKERGRIVLDMIVRYLADGRIIRLLNKPADDPKAIMEIRDPGKMKFDVLVDETPNTVNQKQQTFMVLRELVPVMTANNIPVPPSVVEYLPLPDSLVQDWRQLLEPKPEQEQKPDPIIQGEMIRQQTEIKKEEMRTQAKMQEMQMKMQLEQQQSRLEQEKNELERRDQDIDRMLKERELEIRSREADAKITQANKSHQHQH
jgi:hypothetical protein